jgi:hypothetical protein
MIPSRNALENSVRTWNCSCERSGIIGGIAPIHTRECRRGTEKLQIWGVTRAFS